MKGGLAFDTARLSVIPAVPAEEAQVQACFDAAGDYFALAEGGPADPRAGAELLADAEADELREVLLLVPRAGGPAVGVLDVHLHHPPGSAHIGLLLLTRGARGRGYGREATAGLERAVAEKGCDTLRLSVTDENGQVASFWEHIGFAPAERLDRGVTIYEKVLRGS